MKTKKKPIKVKPREKPEIILPQHVANSNALLVARGYATATKTNSLGQIIELHIDIQNIAKFMASVNSKFEGL